MNKLPIHVCNNLFDILPNNVIDTIHTYKHQMELKDVMDQLKCSGSVCYCGRWTFTTCDCKCDWSESDSDISLRSVFNITTY